MTDALEIDLACLDERVERRQNTALGPLDALEDEPSTVLRRPDYRRVDVLERAALSWSEASRASETRLPDLARLLELGLAHIAVQGDMLDGDGGQRREGILSSSARPRFGLTRRS